MIQIDMKRPEHCVDCPFSLENCCLVLGKYISIKQWAKGGKQKWCPLKEHEVKTGKWIEQTDCFGDTYYDCSVCNESWITIEGTPWVNGMNYCPHCGAKMNFESR